MSISVTSGEPNTSNALNTSQDKLIKDLQDTVEKLSKQLQEALLQIAELKTQRSNPSKESATPQFVRYTLNGIQEQEDENVQTIVTKVVAATSGEFELDETTSVKRIPSKSDNHHVIFLSVKNGSAQHKILEKAKKTRVSGRDGGISCGPIFLNEAHSSISYQLFKKAKILRTKGFRFEWLKNSRVVARKAEGEKVICILKEEDLKKYNNK